MPHMEIDTADAAKVAEANGLVLEPDTLAVLAVLRALPPYYPKAVMEAFRVSHDPRCPFEARYEAAYAVVEETNHAKRHDTTTNAAELASIFVEAYTELGLSMERV